MGSHFLIDGYNLLYALPDMPPGSLQEKREALLRLLKERRPQGHNAATIVFDSRQGSGNRTQQADIAVVFTAGETADAWISSEVRRAAQPRAVVVVSNDQGIRRDIKGTGAKFLSANDFWKITKHETTSLRESVRYEDEAITEEFRDKWR